jgi:hypothetical protein
MNLNLTALSDIELVNAAKDQVRQVNVIEADLIVLLGEVEHRRLHKRLSSSLFSFCRERLGLSEDAAYNRSKVARFARKFPVVLDYLRSGRIHLTGLRLLAKVVTRDNIDEVLEQACGKSKREIEEMVVALEPKPLVPATIRKLPARVQEVVLSSPPQSPTPAPAPALGSLFEAAAPCAAQVALEPVARPVPTRPAVEPLATDAFKVQFTASRAFRDKLEQLQALLRHRIPDGDLGTILEMATDLLLADVKKERFGLGATPRKTDPAPVEGGSRAIPVAIRRAVAERDGLRCTYRFPDGSQCPERGWLEFDHVEGFARTGVHGVESLRMVCRSHNQLAAEDIYGTAFMAEARARRSGTQPRQQSPTFDAARPVLERASINGDGS